MNNTDFPTNANNMPMQSHSEADSVLWSGLMCAVGDTSSAAGIQRCQGPDGRLWRSPSRVGVQKENSFSRDMALGFILYIQATGDYASADRWIEYVQSSGHLFPADESSDNRHKMSPTVWWCASYAGISVPWYYRYTRGMLRPLNILQALFAKKGYQTHLQGVVGLIRAIHDGKRDEILGSVLVSKEACNAFFLWMSGDTISAAAIVEYIKSYQATHTSDRREWCWERTDQDLAWRSSMDWDLLFIEQLLRLPII